MNIKCRDCDEQTNNNTERCGPCKKLWRDNMDIDPQEREFKVQSQEVIDHKYGVKITSTGSVMQCSKCNQMAHTLIDTVCNTCLSKDNDADVINWPKHYNVGKIQPIDFIESLSLDFRLANAVKYIARCEHKGKAKEDLTKAIWYIQRYIDKELCDE